MKRCPECHKLSKDDDFCSHCGSAVYSADNHVTADISCSNYPGHTHEKQSYSTADNNRRNSYAPSSRQPRNKGKKPGCGIVIFLFILANLLPAIISVLDEFF